jgi:coproporphyrinogen III oxidase-like Fe-S oxidoreductase
MLADKLIHLLAERSARRNLTFSPSTSVTGLPEANPDRRYLLYLHIPFCVTLCPFCSFHRVRFKEDRASLYFTGLEQEIALAAELGFGFSEAYFGGGTPTVLPDRLFALIRKLRNDYSVEQVSAETNPDDIHDEVLDKIAGAGINRLSVGVQSFDDDLLKRMERYEKYGSGDVITRRLRNAQHRFDTLNVDMIFNIPSQSESSLRRDLRILTDEVGASQVSWYPLMTAPSTRKSMEKSMGPSDFARERDFYEMITEHMLGCGYARSTAWCYSRGDSLIDEYITDNDEYLGLGSGAFSYIDGAVYGSTFSINHYLERTGRGESGITRVRRLGSSDQRRYWLLMNLFDGSIRRAEIPQRFRASLRAELTALRLIGAVRQVGDRFELTHRGYYLWVVLMREFFTGVNEFRERMRLEIPAEVR